MFNQNHYKITSNDQHFWRKFLDDWPPVVRPHPNLCVWRRGAWQPVGSIVLEPGCFQNGTVTILSWPMWSRVIFMKYVEYCAMITFLLMLFFFRDTLILFYSIYDGHIFLSCFCIACLRVNWYPPIFDMFSKLLLHFEPRELILQHAFWSGSISFWSSTLKRLCEGLTKVKGYGAGERPGGSVRQISWNVLTCKNCTASLFFPHKFTPSQDFLNAKGFPWIWNLEVSIMTFSFPMEVWDPPKMAENKWISVVFSVMKLCKCNSFPSEFFRNESS